MSRRAVPKADGLRIRMLDVKMGHFKGGRLENQDPGCHDGLPQRRMAGESGSWMSRWAVPKAHSLRIRILDVKMGRPKD